MFYNYFNCFLWGKNLRCKYLSIYGILNCIIIFHRGKITMKPYFTVLWNSSKSIMTILYIFGLKLCFHQNHGWDIILQVYILTNTAYRYRTYKTAIGPLRFDQIKRSTLFPSANQSTVLLMNIYDVIIILNVASHTQCKPC